MYTEIFTDNNLYGTMGQTLYEERERLITCVAKKYISSIYNRELTDVIQECWLAVIKADKSYNKFIEAPLVIAVCKAAIFNIIRADSKYQTFSLEQLESDSNFDASELVSSHIDLTDEVCSNLVIEELINVFPKDSKERKYLEFYYEAAGIEDFDIHPIATNCHGRVKNNGYTKEALARYLGFSCSNSSGFVSLTKRMERFVKDWCAN